MPGNNSSSVRLAMFILYSLLSRSTTNAAGAFRVFCDAYLYRCVVEFRFFFCFLHAFGFFEKSLLLTEARCRFPLALVGAYPP